MLALCCHRQQAAWRFARRTLRLVFRLLGLGPVRKGEALPQEAALLVSNHASYLDALLLLAALDRPVCYTPKAEVFAWPLLGRAARRLGALPVERGPSPVQLQSLTRIEQALQQGHLVHVFPEGTFTAEAGLRPFRLGAFQVAAEQGVPVVPVVLRGTREALRAGRFLLHKVPLEVEVRKPLAGAQGAGFRDIVQLRDAARSTLAEAVGEPMLDVTGSALPVAGDERPARLSG